MDHYQGAPTWIYGEHDRTLWDLKRYKKFLKKSYRSKVKPSIIRTRSVKRRPSSFNQVRLASKYGSPSRTMEDEASSFSVQSIGSLGDGSNSSEASSTLIQEEERETYERTASQMTAHKLPTDIEQETFQSLAEVLSESWNLLNEVAWDSEGSHDNPVEQTGIDIVKEIHAIKSLIQRKDLNAADQLASRDSRTDDVSKNGHEPFDKYKLVCPNHVVGRYGPLY